MPQSERSAIIKDFLKWLEAKSKKGGASLSEGSKHIQIDITEMGATQKRAVSYFKDCVRMGLVSLDAKTMKFKITEKGKAWLKTKV